MFPKFLKRSVVSVLLLGALLGGTSLLYPRTSLDSPASTYVGATIVEGGVPYRDAWDLRAPGVYFAYALNIFLLGKSAVAMRLFDFLWQMATALVLYFIARRCTAGTAALLAAALYPAAYYSMHYSTWAQPDGYLNLPMALSFYFAARALESGRPLHWAASAGALGLATLFKLPYGLFGVALLVAATRGQPPGFPQIMRRLAALALGFAAPFTICGLYFYWNGALQDLLTAQFIFAPAYVARIHAALSLRDLLESVLRPVLIPYGTLLVLGVGALGVSFSRRKKLGAPAYLVVAWLAVASFTFFLQGSYLHYHFLPLLPALALLAASRFDYSAADRGKNIRSGQIFLLLLAVFAIGVTAKFLSNARFAWNAWHSTTPIDIWQEPGRAIRERTTPEDRIFVWGNVAALYIHADRRAASRFLVTGFLSVSAPGVDYRSVCIQELRRNPPKLFVLITQGPVTPGLPDSLRSYEDFPELKALVESNYRLAERQERYLVFERK